jgi:hypothetical protein
MAWSPPVVLARMNRDLRFCVDYRNVNDVTKTVSHCTRLTTLWTRWLEKSFPILGQRSGYWHMDLNPDKKTEFKGYGSSVILFGLCDALVTFGRSKTRFKTPQESCLVYLEVAVIGRTFQEHLLNLRKVFQQFREARIKLNPKKSQLFQRKYGTSGILYHQRE